MAIPPNVSVECIQLANINVAVFREGSKPANGICQQAPRIGNLNTLFLRAALSDICFLTPFANVFRDKLLASLGNLPPHAPGLRFEDKRTVVPVPEQALSHARLELTAAFVSKGHNVRPPLGRLPLETVPNSHQTMCRLAR